MRVGFVFLCASQPTPPPNPTPPPTQKKKGFIGVLWFFLQHGFHVLIGFSLLFMYTVDNEQYTQGTTLLQIPLSEIAVLYLK